MKNKSLRTIKKVLIAVVGGIVTIAGIIAIPYPGPGWVIVFAGLTILATEFEWARSILDKLRAKYDEWQDLLRQQPRHIKIAVWCMTAIIVVVTIWLVNGYGLINSFLNLGQDWLKSPLTRM